MYEYLRKHPAVFMPYRKEPVYFGSDLRKRQPYLDEGGYLALFDQAIDARAIGEATVWYLYSETAPAEIKDFSPDARIIIMLRNPIDMMQSLHKHFVFSSSEQIHDFAEALDAESDRRHGRRMLSTAEQPIGLQYRHCATYAPHLRRYLDTFGPDRVRVVIFDDLARDPASTFEETLRFLDVDPTFRPDFEVVNQSKRTRSPRLQAFAHSPAFQRVAARLPPRLFHVLWRASQRANIRPEARVPIDSGLRAQLVRDLAPDVAELSELLGRDLSDWVAAE